MMEARIVKKSIVLELPETLEDGSAKALCDKPYRIERVEYKDSQNKIEVIWFGYNTNWKRIDGEWHKLVDYDFIPCEMPEYENIYLTLRKQ